MQRKPTKNTRGRNAIEKAYQGWLKEQPCAYCGAPGPSIVDHARGATFKHNKTLVGHAFCTSKCQTCDDYKTHGSHNKHFEMTGKTESDAWWEQYPKYIDHMGGQSVFYASGIENAIWKFGLEEKRRYAS
jgi:hypothetical protein